MIISKKQVMKKYFYTKKNLYLHLIPQDGCIIIIIVFIIWLIVHLVGDDIFCFP